MFIKPETNSQGYLEKQHRKITRQHFTFKNDRFGFFSRISYAASTPGGSHGQNEGIKLKSYALTAEYLCQKTPYINIEQVLNKITHTNA